MKTGEVIGVVIAAAVLIIALPILEGALVDAGAVTGASTNFVSALSISELVLGFTPIGILLVLLAGRIRGRGK